MFRTILLLAAAAAIMGIAPPVRAAEPASQPDPGKLVVRLVAASNKPLSDGLLPEDWILKRAADARLSDVVGLTPWMDCTAKPGKMGTNAPIDWRLTVAATRDSAGGVWTVTLTGSATRTLMMVDAPGGQALEPLGRGDNGCTVLLAMQIVPSTFKPVAAFGRPVNNVRMHLDVDPAEWPANARIRFRGLFENIGEADIAKPMWGLTRRGAPPRGIAGLEITNEAGTVVPPKNGTPPDSGAFSVPEVIGPRQTGRLSIPAEFADSKLTLLAPLGGTWIWSLPPGEYQVRALADAGGQFGPLTSQPVTVRVTGKPATQPASQPRP